MKKQLYPSDSSNFSPFNGRILPDAVESTSASYADSLGLNSPVRQHSFVKFGHEINSTAILSLPLIQEGQLSVTGERLCTKYW